jgi:hypothetical protein
MNRLTYILIWILFIVIAAVIFGFVSAQFVGGGVTACTEMACMCEQEGELPCNSCSKEETIFTIGIINIARTCPAREIILCKKNAYSEIRYDITGDCKNKVTWFDFVLDYRK